MAIFYSTGHTGALVYAIRMLHDQGVEFLPCPDRHVTHLLLPIPSFDPDGRIKGGSSLEALLWQLPEDVTVIGGGVDRPELEGYRKIDLLEDPQYLSENAAITAYCAIELAAAELPVIWKDCPVLIVGWGRIGKCLARLLDKLYARVTVAARKETDRALLRAMGYTAAGMDEIRTDGFRLIFNTVPEMVLPECPGGSLKIDLASRPGIGGSDVMWARGLPGKHAPESSGALIARTVLKNLILEGSL